MAVFIRNTAIWLYKTEQEGEGTIFCDGVLIVTLIPVSVLRAQGYFSLVCSCIAQRQTTQHLPGGSTVPCKALLHCSAQPLRPEVAARQEGGGYFIHQNGAECRTGSRGTLRRKSSSEDGCLQYWISYWNGFARQPQLRGQIIVFVKISWPPHNAAMV